MTSACSAARRSTAADPCPRGTWSCASAGQSVRPYRRSPDDTPFAARSSAPADSGRCGSAAASAPRVCAAGSDRRQGLADLLQGGIAGDAPGFTLDLVLVQQLPGRPKPVLIDELDDGNQLFQ